MSNPEFTIETANALWHTLCGLVDLARHLLDSTHDFVMLGEFSSDPLEKAFSKLRQGSGGAYFISVQQSLEKLRIQHTKLLLQLDADFFENDSGHACSGCNRQLSEHESKVFDNLENLESNISDNTKMCLIYIAGYIVHKTENNDNDTFDYYEKFGAYLDHLNRGGLKKPGDCVCQFVILCYIFFMSLDDKATLCRTALASYFNLVQDFYLFGELKKRSLKCKILSNILLNNYSKYCTPRSSKEPAQKVLKLSFE